MNSNAPLARKDARGAFLFSALTLFTMGMVACGGDADPAPSGTDQPELPGTPLPEGRPEEIIGKLDALAAPCTFSGGTLTVVVQSGETAIIARRTSDDIMLVNSAPCTGATTATATATNRLVVNEGAIKGGESVLLDYRNGYFVLGSATASSGTFVNIGGSPTDSLQVMTDDSANAISAGSAGLNLNGDNYRDITITANGVTLVTFSLGDGNDSFTGAGGGTVLGATAFPFAVRLYGGPGNDSLRGGTRNDELFGDAGTDTLVADATSAMGADTFTGGADSDSLDFSTRAQGVTISLDNMANDGAAGEGDNVMDDIEVITGSSGDDVLTGTAGANTFNAGAGNDTMTGGAGNDVLSGDAGNDTFLEGSADSGLDTLNGGAGVDTVDYGLRTNAVTVTIGVDGDSDGEGSEGDIVKSDVENVVGGAGNDTLTGNASNNRFTGGLGNDTMTGGDGDDVFYEGSLTSGADVFNGGAGFDVVDYGARSVAVVVTMGDDTANDGQASETDNFKPDCEKVVGSVVADTLTGGTANDYIDGGDGNDTIVSGAGNDVIDGEAGDDNINCGTGNDVALGGAGTNTIDPSCEITML
jgi:Ca2+-binding RTX toxin-like protein